MDGDIIVVGAVTGPDANETGAAYVFVRPSGLPIWIQQAKLTAPATAPASRSFRRFCLCGRKYHRDRGNGRGAGGGGG